MSYINTLLYLNKVNLGKCEIYLKRIFVGSRIEVWMIYNMGFFSANKLKSSKIE